MTLQILIKDKISKKSSEQIAQLLGYSTTNKFDKRVKEVTESPYLALDKSYYDFHYSSREFIRRLSEVLGIPEHLYNKVIAEIEATLALNRQKKPYFFLETNFKRESQPIFMLAALQNNRFLSVDKEIYNLLLNEQLIPLTTIVKKHNKQHPVIDMWGEVQSYVYLYTDETVLVFSTSGELLSSETEYFYSKAILALK